MDFLSSGDLFLVISAVLRRVVVCRRSRAVDFDSAPEFGLWEEEVQTTETGLRDWMSADGVLEEGGNEILTPCKMAQI